MSRAAPGLSVVVTTYNAREVVGECLDSLRRQETGAPFEVILVDSSADGTAGLVREEYPEVRLIESPRRLHCGDARNRALAVARGEVIAFLDADCRVGPGWVDAVLGAHRAPAQLIGGIIDNADPKSPVGWAYYFSEYSLWLPARSPRVIRETAGCCLSLKRPAYDRYGPFVEGTYSSDTAFQWKARRAGLRVRFVPGIRVRHLGPTGLGRYLAHTFEHRRDYARVKSRERGFSPLRRALAAAVLTITPPLLMGAVLLRLRRCPRYLPYFAAASPLLFLGYCARSCGEFAGYLFPGPGRRRPAGNGAGLPAAVPVRVAERAGKRAP